MTAQALINKSPQQPTYSSKTACVSSISLVLALLAMFGSPSFLSAQEVSWYQDYASARQEARATGRPVLYNFSTTWCGYCRKLEVTTFQDPRVRRLLRDYFVAVKLDGDREFGLVADLGISVFPTLIVSDAAGQIIFRHNGFLEADHLVSTLEQVKGRATASELPLPSKQRQNWGGQTAATLLAQARADAEAGLDLACLQRCLILLHNHPHSPEVEAARILLHNVKSEPARLAQLQRQLQLLQAELSLAQAEILVAQGAKGQAAAVLEATLHCLGDTPAAEQIQRRVKELKTSASEGSAAPATERPRP